MTNVPIFDSLTHPMPNGNWLHEKYTGLNTIESLSNQMKQAHVKWALAVGMGRTIGTYQESTYPHYIYDHTDNVFPVAYIDYPAIAEKTLTQLDTYFKELVSLGYVGIKLHPRFGRFSFSDESVPTFIKIAADNELAVLLCTYCWENTPKQESNDPFSMMKMLSKLDSAPVILLHAGGVLLMQYIEIARAFNNVLLDLSLTISKYKGSSLDMDIRFAFNQFDRRICIGSDGPEYLPQTLRDRFEYFSTDVEKSKLKNIAYKNLFSFLPLIKTINQSKDALV